MISSDNSAIAVDQDRASCAVLFQRGDDGLLAAFGAFVGIAAIELEFVNLQKTSLIGLDTPTRLFNQAKNGPGLGLRRIGSVEIRTPYPSRGIRQQTMVAM